MKQTPKGGDRDGLQTGIISANHLGENTARQPMLVRKTYNHLDQLIEDAAHWDFCVRPLERGQPGHQLINLIDDGFQFASTVMQSSCEKYAAGPIGLRTVIMLDKAEGEPTWCWRPFSANTLILTPKSDQFEGISLGRFSNLAYSFREADLASIAEHQFHVDWYKMVGEKGNAYEFSAKKMCVLRDKLRQLNRLLQNAQIPQNLEHLKDELAADLISGLCESHSIKPGIRAMNRDNYFNAAREYIDQNLAYDVRIPTLCQSVGVSIRTLEYAFMERLGITPKTYLTRRRLTLARKNLLAAVPGSSTVTEVGLNAGFWHMGQFSKDYRKFFGEHPKDTLRLCA